MTIEERQARITEIIARQQELDTESAGLTFTDEQRAEFETLAAERVEQDAALEELRQRRSYLEEQAQDPASREDGTVFHTRQSGVARGDDIWDLTTIRSSVSSPEEAVRELHERSKRAIEIAVFPDGRVRKEHAQEHIERLLARDSADGELGRLILTTGKPGYRQAFVKYLGGVPLTGEEQRAFTLGSTGLPVPYTLDPTVLPVSNSVVNPLRAISSVEQIVGSNEWRGLTAAAITASRVSEATEATDNTPVLAQPTILASKVHAFVPFSIESGQDWSGMDSALATLIADSKDDEEATSFATGTGTPPAPFGVLTGATGTTAAATGLTVTAANLYSLEGALAPRFRPRAQFVANRAIYNIIRALDTAGGAQMWLRIGELMGNSPASDGGNGNTGLRLLGYPVNELSTMSATVVNTTKIMLLGDFSYFKIIDRVGMTVELIPHLFGAANRYPTGQRGFYAYWRNGSKVIDPVAFRALTGTT
ncbi:MAG TPA: phage major capsid protein [Vicinamibacterales bacterium]|nr:phage major capsid protein [Vicinamibacterales bacterium]